MNGKMKTDMYSEKHITFLFEQSSLWYWDEDLILKKSKYQVINWWRKITKTEKYEKKRIKKYYTAA